MSSSATPGKEGRQVVISIMKRDRVGIVADVTAALQELDGNLADLSQTVLRGYFTMIMVADFPASVGLETIRETLAAVAPEDPFEIGLKLPDVSLVPEPRAYPQGHYVLTAVGPDRIGLVAEVSAYLRDRDINIDDLATQAEHGRYTMIFAVDLPPATDVGKFQREMQAAMDPTGVTAVIQHHDIFRALNEI